MFPYHILVTLDRNYLKVLSVMLYSLSQSDPEGVYTVYVVNNTLTEEDFASLSALLPRTELVNVQVPEDLLQNAPVSDRYPTEMYYRLFAARYLPQQLERILYLDPDLVVLHSLRSLYQIDFDGMFRIKKVMVRVTAAQPATAANPINWIPSRCSPPP